MTVAENIVLGSERSSLALDLKAAATEIRKLSEEFKLAVNQTPSSNTFCWSTTTSRTLKSVVSSRASLDS
jgi:ABC-type uncharacterized transport system ATPase subunit